MRGMMGRYGVFGSFGSRSIRSVASGSLTLSVLLTAMNFRGHIGAHDLTSPAVYVTFGLFLIATALGLGGSARKWRQGRRPS